MADDRPEKQPNLGTPMTTRAIVLWGLGLVAIGVLAFILLVRFFGGGSERDRQQLEVFRTAGTVVVGTGGIAALYLAARRQQSAERTLAHQRHVAEKTEHDAVERRIAEQYTKAADQLGSENSVVRTAGLYALQHLGNSSTERQQTIVDLLCAYLRMPLSTEIPEDEAARRDWRQQREARLTAQRILTSSLKGARRWTGVDVNLSGALLEDFDLMGGRLNSAIFIETTFEGFTRMSATVFDRSAFFREAHFNGYVAFDKASFNERVSFLNTYFNSEDGGSFKSAIFARNPGFRSANVRAELDLAGARIKTGAGHTLRGKAAPRGWVLSYDPESGDWRYQKPLDRD
ncbi:pentapeptide repeat-containing protein [Pseudonocardia halophobica]|uniref:pentapeptide repeat-containing protein n=1 Tax=Pseudonocardia halophobica TaxID=29401 RepID=UPI003D8BD945